MIQSESKQSKSIHSRPEDNHPWEKLLRQGAETLSNSELLAILLRTGDQGASTIDLVRHICARLIGRQITISLA